MKTSTTADTTEPKKEILSNVFDLPVAGIKAFSQCISLSDILNDDNSVFSYPKFVNDKKGCMTYSGYYMRKYVIYILFKEENNPNSIFNRNTKENILLIY